MGALSLLSLGGATYMGLQAQQHETNANNPTFVGRQLEIDLASQAQLYANVGFVLSAAFAASALGWGFISSEDDGSGAAKVSAGFFYDGNSSLVFLGGSLP